MIMIIIIISFQIISNTVNTLLFARLSSHRCVLCLNDRYFVCILTEEYVTCHTCRSPDTILQKETRLFFIQCETCGSRRSVASIKSGFQAITQKRAQLKSKQQ